MPLDPQTRTALERLKSINFALTHNMTPMQARKRERALTQLMSHNEQEAVARIENLHIPGPVEKIPIRIYTPQGEGPFPILIYFHSGGGVTGDLDSEDTYCRRLTNLAKCLVVSVGYHLAPEYKFPSGPEECYAASQWVAKHAASFNGDPSKIAVGGMSAGANLAAVVTHMISGPGRSQTCLPTSAGSHHQFPTHKHPFLGSICSRLSPHKRRYGLVYASLFEQRRRQG